MYCCCCLVTKSLLTLCNPMDYSLPGSPGHGILQARILECVAISYSRGFSWPRDCTRVSCIAARFFTVWATELSYYQAYPLLDIYLHTEVDSHSVFQGIFLTQGSNLDLLHCRQILLPCELPGKLHSFWFPPTHTKIRLTNISALVELPFSVRGDS